MRERTNVFKRRPLAPPRLTASLPKLSRGGVEFLHEAERKDVQPTGVATQHGLRRANGRVCAAGIKPGPHASLLAASIGILKFRELLPVRVGPSNFVRDVYGYGSRCLIASGARVSGFDSRPGRNFPARGAHGRREIAYGKLESGNPSRGREAIKHGAGKLLSAPKPGGAPVLRSANVQESGYPRARASNIPARVSRWFAGA